MSFSLPLIKAEGEEECVRKADAALDTITTVSRFFIHLFAIRNFVRARDR